MNYFERQRHLNRQTRYLYFLFILMTVFVLFITNLIFSQYNLAPHSPDNFRESTAVFRWYSPLSLTISFGIFLAIFSGYLNSRLNLNKGTIIAENLGGTEVTGNTHSPYYKVLNQVVDEMAIASGVPAPRIFVIMDNHSINAFAAGFAMSDAVIAVTEGALQQLTRTELQALVAHEMGHIVHQDMRLNMHLIAVLAGFMGLTVLGFKLIRSIRFSHYSNNRNAQAQMSILLLAVLLVISGYLLYFLGRILQSHIAHKREYVADNHSVIALRDAKPMISLLTKISRKPSDKAHDALGNPEYQHFLFNSAHYYMTFKTHPPLKQRLAVLFSFLPKTSIADTSPELTIHENILKSGHVVKSPEAPLEKKAKEPIKQIAKSIAIAGLMEVASNTQDHAPALKNSNKKYTNDQKISHSAHQEIDFLTPAPLESANEVLGNIPEALTQLMYDQSSVEWVYYAFFLADEEAEKNAQARLFTNEHFDKINEIKALIDETTTHCGVYLIAELTFPIFCQLTLNKQNALLKKLENMMTSKRTLRQYCLYSSLKKLQKNAMATQRLLITQPANYNLLKITEEVYYLFSIIAQKASHYEDKTLLEAHFMETIKSLYPASNRKMLVLDDDWIEHLSNALTKIDELNPEAKTKFVNALLFFINRDGIVTYDEYELIRFITLCLDYPLPLTLMTDGNAASLF